MKMKTLGIGAVLTTLVACANAGGYDSSPTMSKSRPGGDYQKVSDLVPLPSFIPGMGELFVQPKTLPAGPFLAYDRKGQLVSTIYMVPLSQMERQTPFSDLAVGDPRTLKVDMMYNAGHPGVAEPHYHVVLWHVSPERAELK